MRGNFHKEGRCPIWIKITGFTLMGITGAIVFSLIFGLAAQWLWNHTLVGLFHWPSLSYWQAVGLLILSRLFFGHFGGRPHGPYRSSNRWSRHHWKERFYEPDSHKDTTEDEENSQRP